MQCRSFARKFSAATHRWLTGPGDHDGYRTELVRSVTTDGSLDDPAPAR